MAPLTVALILSLSITLIYSKTCDQTLACTDIDIEEDIYCRGWRSCADSSLISTADAYCVGNLGCSNSKSIAAANVYCYGDTACADSANLEAVSGSVVCSGIMGCADIKNGIKASNDIICAGVSACADAGGDLIAGGSIECAGEYSCSNVAGVLKAFYVGASASDAARDNTFEVEDKAYFSGSYSGWGSTIHANGNIQCDGPYSCGSTKMRAADDIRLFGYGSGYKSFMEDTPNLYAHGYYGAAYSDIIAVADQSLNAQFYGLYSGYYANVWCEKGAQCTVSCKGTGCLETAVFYEDMEDVSIEPKGCLKNQGGKFSSMDCPVLVKYTAETKDEAEQERMDKRQSTKKWKTLDDDYSVGDFGNPQPMILMDEEIDGAVIISDIEDKRDPMVAWFVIFGVLLGCIGIAVMMRWIWNNRKDGKDMEKLEKLQAGLMYT